MGEKFVMCFIKFQQLFEVVKIEQIFWYLDH
jgi:hypothetical protein